MKKPVLAFIVMFVVGTAAATGAKVMTTKAGSAVKADSTHADSTGAAKDSTKSAEHGDTAVVASGEAVHAPADTMPRAAVPAAQVKKDSTVHAPDAKAVVAAAKAVGVPPAPSKTSNAAKAITDSVIDASERRIAKVFTAMDAKQAAKVLEHMTDADVQVILGYVGPKQAAAIMVQLPPERAAKLGKRAMLGSPAR